jgi:hypothetical protein
VFLRECVASRWSVSQTWELTQCFSEDVHT